MAIEFENHKGEVLTEFRAAIRRALIRMGNQAEGYAKDLCPKNTGALRNSITNEPREKEVVIGSAMEYAAYVELGTGCYYPGGRDTPWAFKDEKGNWHMIMGTKPQPYLKPALTDHVRTYGNIIKDELEGL